MRETLSGVGAVRFFVALAAARIGRPWLIGHVAEHVSAGRYRAAGEPEPEGGYRLAFLPATRLLIPAAPGGPADGGTTAPPSSGTATYNFDGFASL